jgi:hypothetical protein
LSASHPSRAHNARNQIDLVHPGAAGTGLVLQQTKHTHLERQCDCGHWTRAEPGLCGEEADWTVALTDWHLAGPTLVTFIVGRRSREVVRQVLGDAFRNWPRHGDGYWAYRELDQRLRCLAHIIRKVHGLEDSVSSQIISPVNSHTISRYARPDFPH